MKRSSSIKIVSGILNLFICLIIVIIVLIRQNYFGAGDIYAFFFWTIPLAVGLSLSGQTIVSILKVRNPFLRRLLILLTSILISIGWLYVVYFVLGPWINTFSFPIAYIWIFGNAVQLLFLDWRLPKPEERKVLKLLIKLLLFPASLALTLILIFCLSFLKEYLTRPEKEIYLIPNNINGKFRVIYGEKCGQRPAFENGRRVMKIPSTRILIIQPKFQAGVIDNEYYLVDGKGMRTKINERLDYDKKSSKSPEVSIDGTGSMAGDMPDRSLSSESPLAIHFTDFILYNGDSNLTVERQRNLMEDKFDSVTKILVNSCRLRLNNK